MNKILGSITLRDSDLVVPHLLVTVFDTMPRAAARRAARTKAKAASARDKEAHWIRLGSVVTGQQGTFTLEYEVPDPKRRPDLALVVSALEESGGSDPARIATVARRGAANTESFRILLDAARLKAA